MEFVAITGLACGLVAVGALGATLVLCIWLQKNWPNH